MPSDPLIARSMEHLHALCVEIESRRIGSAGNLAATRYAAETLRSLSFRVETPTFACIDWSDDGANVTIGNDAFAGSPEPVQPGVQGRSVAGVRLDNGRIAHPVAAASFCCTGNWRTSLSCRRTSHSTTRTNTAT
jgi:hypothetical protein